MNNLLTYIRSLTAFSDKNWEMLLPVLTKIEFKRREYLLKEGEVCNSLFFIENGYCRSYYNKDGVEKNTSFFFENSIATNIISFGSGERSMYFIRSCEPMTVIVFDKQKLMEASRQSHEIETLGRNCMRVFASRQELHADLFKLYTAQERYEFLEQNETEMLQRVSLTQLSSFLGIARETLSRIRKRRMPAPGL